MADKRLQLDRLTPEQHATLAHNVMRRQARLSVRVAAVFLVALFGLPLVNYVLPGLANTPVGGFTATWLFLGVLFYPLTWALSWYFIRESDRIESECSDWRAVLGAEAGEPLEPQGVGDIQPAFIATDAATAESVIEDTGTIDTGSKIQNPKSKIQNEEDLS